MTTDPELVNAWGLAFNPIGAAWVSSTERGLSKVYDAKGADVLPAVEIPAAGGAMSAPTGQVFNDDASAFMGDTFIFVTEEGAISGWQSSMATKATLRVDSSKDEAVYKGVTIAKDGDGSPMLFAADFHGGKIDVFDSSYAPVTRTGFDDPNIPDEFAPFNVEVAGDSLIVTYAMQDDEKEDDVKGPGHGFVDLFDTTGSMKARLISQGELDSPWGVTMTPSGFAAAPNRLLIGNFGDGMIHVYEFDQSAANGATARLDGALRDAETNQPVTIDGLWALKFGVDAGGFSSKQLYFTAGPADETHGTFGALEAASVGQGADGGGTDRPVVTGGSGGRY